MNSSVVISSSPQDLKTKMKPLMKNYSINLLEAKTEQFVELHLVKEVHWLYKRTGTLESCITAKEIIIKGGQKKPCIFLLNNNWIFFIEYIFFCLCLQQCHGVPCTRILL